MGRAASWCMLVALLAGCGSAQPPARWQEGGAPLLIPHAEWDTGGDVVELRPDGQVLIDGELAFVIDEAGRIYDPEHAPIGLLEPDGRIVGTDEHALGVVGSMHAALPGGSEAWLSVLPNGAVVRYGEDGERYAGGVWRGCGAAASSAQACVLTTHLVLLDAELRRRRQGGPSFGFGLGVMIVR